MNSPNVNPPGFDIRNAQSAEDVQSMVLDLCGRKSNVGSTLTVYGQMIIGDRLASLTVSRRVLTLATARGRAVSDVMARIRAEVADPDDSIRNLNVY